MYDVNEKRVQRVFKVCKKYLSHHQNSIFRGEITPSKLIKLKSEIQRIIESSEDYVTIIKMVSENVFAEEDWGVVKDSESLIL